MDSEKGRKDEKDEKEFSIISHFTDAFGIKKLKKNGINLVFIEKKLYLCIWFHKENHPKAILTNEKQGYIIWKLQQEHQVEAEEGGN